MTMYKCEQCADVWSKGPMRDAILEGWTCPSCITAKLQAAEETGAEATRIIVAAVSDQMSALNLVSRIREAIGDNGRRMQDELIGYCAQLYRSNKAIEEERDGFWRSRAEAAEAEVERLTDCLETQYEINRNTARAACEARGDHFDAEDRIAELEALRDEFPALTKIVVDSTKRTATEAALGWAWNEYINSNFVIDPNGFIERGLLDLLVEK